MLKVGRRTGGLEEARAKVLLVRDDKPESGLLGLGPLLPKRDQREVGNKFATASEITGDFHPRKLGMLLLQRYDRMLKERRGL